MFFNSVKSNFTREVQKVDENLQEVQDHINGSFYDYENLIVDLDERIQIRVSYHNNKTYQI